MGTTTHGLSYPDPTDFVIDGDDAIQALAEETDDAVWSPWQDGGNFSGVTIGNGSQKTRYRIHGTTCEIQGGLLLGSTSSVTGLLGLSLPVNGAGDTLLGINMSMAVGVAWAEDTSASVRVQGAVLSSGSSLFFRRAATSEGGWGVGGTVPFSWGDGDWLSFSAVYEID